MRGVTLNNPPSYRTVGRYRVYAELASGGMATVHLGCLLGPAGFSKLVAIKCLHEQFAVEKEFVSMFLDEARLASSIHHPNVVASLDVVAEQGELLVVMEYVHGETLAALLRMARHTGDAPSPGVVTRIVCDALEGLHAAHVASLAGQCLNIVHRDVSPQNIMVGADGNTRVLDFGIAQAALRSQVTAAGTVKGKIAYMSPEQVSGQGVDARTDVFAAGVVLWEALTRQRLFFAPDSRDVPSMLLSSVIPAPSKIVPTISAELDRVVLRALERNREQRYQSAHEFAEALRGATSEGSRREVADWVGRVAKDALARRLELLQAMEASAIHTQAAIAVPVVVTASSPHAVPLPAESTVTAPAAAPNLENTQTRAISTTSLMPLGTPPAPPRRLPWVIAGAGVAIAVACWAFVSTRPAPHAAASSLPSLPSLSPLPSAPRESVALAVAQPGPPTLAVESLPLAPPPASPSASAPQPKPSSLPVPATVKPAVKAGVNVAPVAPAGPNRTRLCSPPYRIDASGVRRVKPECL